MSIVTAAIDLVKNFFVGHGVGDNGKAVLGQPKTITRAFSATRTQRNASSTCCTSDLKPPWHYGILLNN